MLVRSVEYLKPQQTGDRVVWQSGNLSAMMVRSVKYLKP